MMRNAYKIVAEKHGGATWERKQQQQHYGAKSQLNIHSLCNADCSKSENNTLEWPPVTYQIL
jgi:hypothetical protein